MEKIRKNAIKSVASSKLVNADLGAASASCLTWWIEEQRGISEELQNLRDERFVSRIRGALADLRNRDNSNSISDELTLMIPIHQAWLPSIRKAISSCTNVEEITPEE